MAFDIKSFAYESDQKTLYGVSRQVAGDHYNCAYVCLTGSPLNVFGGLTANLKTDEYLLTIDFMPATGNDTEWKVFL